MTRDQIAARLQANLQDLGVFYETADLNDSIQDGYSEIVSLTGCIFKAARVAQVSNLTYYDMAAYIPDFWAVTAIWNTNTKRWLTPTNIKLLDDLRNDWELANGNPFLFWPVNFRFVAFYPKLATASGYFYIFYRAQADTLSASTIPNIPEDLQGILEDYSTCDLLEQAEEFTKAKLQFTEYVKGIRALKQATRSFRLPDLSTGLANAFMG